MPRRETTLFLGGGDRKKFKTGLPGLEFSNLRTTKDLSSIEVKTCQLNYVKEAFMLLASQ